MGEASHSHDRRLLVLIDDGSDTRAGSLPAHSRFVTDAAVHASVVT